MRHTPYLSLYLVISLAVGACSSNRPSETASFFERMFSADTFRLYRMDIPQGNVLTAETIAEIKPGMSKEQVAFLLGKPILPSMFREDRWDYVYYVDSLYKENERHRLVVFFDKNRAVRIRKKRSSPAKRVS